MPRKMIFIGIGLGFMIWLAGAVSDAFVFKKGLLSLNSWSLRSSKFWSDYLPRSFS